MLGVDHIRIDLASRGWYSWQAMVVVVVSSPNEVLL
jgi:hypothetical protein